jgi:TonB-dependent receptor
MRDKKTGSARLIATAAVAMAGFSGAATAGELLGQVTDQAGAQSLEGALVEVVELRRTEESAIDGRFRFADVPAGEYTLRVRYAAAAPYTQRVTVPQIGSVSVDVALAGVSGDEEILVIGQRASLASAISRQRASDTIESVLTRDGIGQFPDQNVAEAVRRAPGVNVLNDQGEGRFVAVRGLSPDLNAASINGVRVTAPEADVRSVALDVIPSDLIESIEIQKSLTPDMDADSLGGSINIQTTRGFDRREPLLAFRAEGSYNDLNGEWSPRYSVDYSRAFGNLGVAGGLSFTNRQFATDNIEADGWSEEGGVVFANEMQYRDYDVERTRIGGSLSLDYRVGNETTLFARGLHSVFEDHEFRGRLTFEMDDEDPTGTATSASFVSDDDNDARIRVERDMKDRFEEQTISSLLFGGLSEVNGWTLRYEASSSFAEEQERGSLDPINFRRNFDDLGELAVTFDYSNWRRPGFDVTTGEALFLDPSEYEFNDVERTTVSDSQDEELAFRFDIAREFALASGGTFEFQFGARERQREKTFNADIDFFENDALTLADFVGRASYGLAAIDPLPSPGAFGSFFRNNFAGFERAVIDSAFDSLVSDYSVEEDITAAYVMGRFDRGPLRAIAGLRIERTQQDVRGNLVELVEDGGTYTGGGALVEDDGDRVFVTPIGFDRDYTNWLPSLNLRYEPVDDVVLRLGAYRSVLRPRPGQIAPRFLVEQNDGGDREGEFGNPALEPYTAWNYDLTAEWYFGSNAVFQGGLFYKEIRNFIVELEADGGPDDPFGGVFNGVAYDEAVIPVNGDDATVFGFELGYAQALDFLPGILGGMVLSANYTYTDSEGSVFGRTIPLPASSENTYNITLGYDQGPLDVRFAVAYRDGYLDELGGDADEDRLVEDHIQYDLTVKYDLNDQIQLYTEFVNLSDEPYVAYQRGPSGPRLLQYEEYSWTGKLGVRARF